MTSLPPTLLRRQLAETPADPSLACDYARFAMATRNGDAAATWLGAAAALAPFNLDLAGPLRDLGRA